MTNLNIAAKNLAHTVAVAQLHAANATNVNTPRYQNEQSIQGRPGVKPGEGKAGLPEMEIIRHEQMSDNNFQNEPKKPIGIILLVITIVVFIIYKFMKK